MKYILSLLITLLAVLPNMNAQSDLQAQIEAQVQQQIHYQVEHHNANQKDENCVCPNGGFLGIESSSVSNDKAEKLGFDNSHGSYITKVFNNSAAQKAGLRPFDYIYGINNDRTEKYTDLTDLLGKYEPGESVTVHYMRDGRNQTVNLTLGDRNDGNWESPKKEKAFLGISHLANSSSCEDKANGVKVNVVNNSTAESMGLEDGDIITHINGHPIIDWDDVTTAIGDITPGEKIKVAFSRDGQDGIASSDIRSYADSKNYAYKKPTPKPKLEYKPKPEPKKENHEYAFFGVYTEDISKDKARKLGADNPYGSYVTGIIPGTAAEKSGISQMDYIFGFDEYRTGERQSLTGILKKYTPGDRAVVHYVRKGKKTNSEVTFGSKSNIKEKKKVDKDKCEDSFFGITSAGYGNGTGVKVNVVKNASAEKMGLQNGDVILTIDGHIMADWDDIGMAIDQINPGDKITVGFDRQGTTIRICEPIMSYAEAKNCKDCDCNEYNYTHNKNYDNHKDDYVIAKGGGNWDDMSEGRIDLSDVEISISEVSQDIWTEKGGSISASNNLTVRDLELDADEDKGLFELGFELPNSGNTSVKVYNKTGRVIYDYDLGNFSGEFEDNIDLAQNGTGAYFLVIKQGSKSLTKKIELK